MASDTPNIAMELPATPEGVLPYTKLPTYLGLGLAAVLLIDWPGGFTSGYVLRRLVWTLALLITTGIVAYRSLQTPRSCTRYFWLALPVAVPLLGILGGPSTFSNWCRHAFVWFALPLQAWILLQLIRRDAHAGAAMRIWLLAGGIAAAWIFLRALRVGDASGPFGRPGVAGVVVASFMPWALAFAPGQMLTRAIFLLPLLGALIQTGSRTAMVGAIAGFFVLIMAIAVPAVRKKLRLPFLGLGIAAIVMIVLAFQHTLPVPGGSETLDVRAGMARASTTMIQREPLRGHGLGNFAAAVLPVRDLREAQLESGRSPSHAHNDYLHVASEGGILAGIAFLAFVILAFFRFFRAVDGARSPGGRLIRAAAAGSFATVAFSALAEGVFLDPAPALCAAVAIGLGTRNPEDERACPFPRGLLWFGAAALMLFFGWHLQRDMVADRYVILARQTGGPRDNDTESKRFEDIERRRISFADHALSFRVDTTQAHYIRGIALARLGKAEEAKKAYKDALRFDSSNTDARLNLASLHVASGQPEKARAVLDEASALDPTRYDVAMRRAHHLFGPEPVPGDKGEPASSEVLTAYNRARALAPTRFENFVADARMLRRGGAREDLERSGARLRTALENLGATSVDAPPELLIESFRLAEAEGDASEQMLAGLLQFAMEKNRGICGNLEREALRFLDLGEERIREAKQRVSVKQPDLDTTGADRAFRAGTIRLAALALTGWVAPKAAEERAHTLAKERRFRRSVSWWRSLLTLSAVTRQRGSEVIPSSKHADWLIAAAKAASRYDAALSRGYYHQGHMLLGAEMMAAKQWKQAKRLLAKVVEQDPKHAKARLALANTLAHLNELEPAGDHLVQALKDDPSLTESAREDPVFKPLRGRSDVDLALSKSPGETGDR